MSSIIMKHLLKQSIRNITPASTLLWNKSTRLPQFLVKPISSFNYIECKHKHTSNLFSSNISCNFSTSWIRNSPATKEEAKKPDVAKEENNIVNPEDILPSKKLGIIGQFKEMYQKYWYVLVPVHVVTSTGWMTLFYYLSKSGVDIPSMLQAMSISDSIIDRLKDSSMGHLAIAYMCYKVMTPIRYMVTVGGTTVSIKYLVKWGYIKPILSKKEFRKMYDDKKASLKQNYEDLQDKASSVVSNVKKSKK